MFPSKTLGRAPEDERAQIDGGEWEPCVFTFDGFELTVVRQDDPFHTCIQLWNLDEIRVHLDEYDAIAEIELRPRDGQRVVARPRPSLIDRILAHGWDTDVTITIEATPTPTAAPPRRRANF